MIRLESGNFGWDYILRDLDTGETILIQTDWDYPGVASNFGFVSCERCPTDGTVDCEHKTAHDIINEAASFLDDHIGDTIEDPGYFGE